MIYDYFRNERKIKSIVYEPYTDSIFYSIPSEKMIFRKYLRDMKNNSNQDDLILPIAPIYNGGAINLEVDSYNSLLCWLRTSDHQSILCSDLNGESVTTVFSLENHLEKIVGFALDSMNSVIYILSMVSPVYGCILNTYIIQDINS